ncbi:MAG: NAD(P)-binding domain-containing protein [Pseudomonadales bacterium]|nr:NAD(P)-binding domain-containing protein [Pseudomonadales bacterium]
MSTSTIGNYDVVVVGGGAAGVGVGVALKHAGIENFVIIERERIGASFAKWPAETRFITPSFPTNSIGMLDLNSVALGISPAFSLEVEHPTGLEYADHLHGVAGFYELPVAMPISVEEVNREDDIFQLRTSKGTVSTRHLIWAAGEFQYPLEGSFEGCELCRHTSTVPSYNDLEGEDFVVIGGYESGIDAAYHLGQRDKLVRVFDRDAPWEKASPDPSVSLSPFTLQRMRKDWFFEKVNLFQTQVASVTRDEEGYLVTTQDGSTFSTDAPPLWAGGFAGSHTTIADFCELREDGFPLLNEYDESTVTPGLFLCGPAVRHDSHIFFFIYKYRQRFAVVAKTIATALGLPAEGLDVYRMWGMYLDDLSCCGEDCVC